MKKLLFLLCLVPGILLAQVDDSSSVLIDQVESQVGFGGLLLEFSPFQGKAMTSIGGAGGVVINDRFVFGGYGLGNVNQRTWFGQDSLATSVSFGHGGLLLGYVHRRNHWVHLGFSSRFGWGYVAGRVAEENIEYREHVFIVSPQVEVEFNITEGFRIKSGAGYRAVFGLDHPTFRTSDRFGPIVNVGFFFE